MGGDGGVDAAVKAAEGGHGSPLFRLMQRLGHHRWYGVCVLCAAMLGAVATAPSHSYVIGLYTEPLARAGGVDVWQINALWSVAMVGAAGALAMAGPMVDWLGPSAAFCAAGLTLASSVAVLSCTRELGAMLFSFLLIRCSGSGLMLTALNKAVNSWWVRRRGMANAVAASGISLAISTPPLCIWLTDHLASWRAGLRVVVGCLLTGVIVATLVLRDSPADMGLKTDCEPLPEEEDGEQFMGAGGEQLVTPAPTKAAVHGLTRTEATRSLIFWSITFAALLTDVFFVGFNLHAVMLMQERGLSESEAGGVFLSVSIAHAVGTLMYGIIVVDAVRDKRKLLVMNSAVACVAMLAGAAFHGMRMAHVFGVVFGAMHAMVFLSLDATIPHFFGLKHLGSISGLARGISFFGGASGPLLFDFCKAKTGSYTLTMVVCAGLMASVGCLACFAHDTSLDGWNDGARGKAEPPLVPFDPMERAAEERSGCAAGGDDCERAELLRRQYLG